ncbi:MAG: hypothetical protein KAJ19_11115 [Gammaproteobacteria bacterium]|nr:hypothetical protein [Gammaproteobacteria bacterium]
MAVKKATSRTRSRLPSGIHEVASKAKDITPVPTKTRRFEKAKTTLTPFISKENRGDDQIEVVDVSAAIQSRVSEKTLKDLGVSTSKIKEAKQAVVEVEDRPVPQTQSLAVPTPIVRPAPKPGEKLKVDKDITKAAKEMRFAATQIVGQTGFIGSADISLANKAAALDTVVKDVERGNLTNAEAKDRVAQIKDQPPSGPLSDALYVVPGYGTFLSYQDARDSGWSPVETGFFAASVATDALLFFGPIKKAGGAVTRVTVNTPKKVIGRIPFAKAEKAFADSTVVTRDQQAIWNRGLIAAGKMRLPSDPAFGTGRPKVVTATVEAPPAPTRTRPQRTDPGPVRTQPGKPRRTPRPDRLDPEEAPAVKPRRKTDEPLPKPGPLDDPMVIPSPTPVPDQPPSEEPERVFEFQPDPDAVEIQTTPTPEEITEIQSETRTETAESGTTGPQTTRSFPGTRFEGFPRDFPFPPGQRPDETTRTETPSKTDLDTTTDPETVTELQPAEFTSTGGQTKTQPQSKPETTKQTDPFTRPGGGQTKTQPQPKPKLERPRVEGTKTPGKGLPDFELPEGKKLPKGFFPKTVSWPQGAVQITYDLATGRTTYKGRTPDKKSPRDGFRVTQITRTPPPPRVLDMGVTDALVTTESIRFRRSRTYQKDRSFKRSRGRL